MRLHFIAPGKRVQNVFVESFTGRLREECLTAHWFLSLPDARRTVEAWRVDYNQSRPHSALGYRPPEEVALPAPTPSAAQQVPVGLSQ